MGDTNQAYPVRSFSWPNSQTLCLGWTSIMPPGLVSVMFLTDSLFILCHIYTLPCPQNVQVSTRMWLFKCSKFFLFLWLFFIGLPQWTVCASLISPESLEVTLPLQHAGWKITAKSHSWQRYIPSIPVFNTPQWKQQLACRCTEGGISFIDFALFCEVFANSSWIH